MTNIQAIDLLKGLEQSLDDYCELNDEGKTAFRMAITALELFGNTEQLPSAQPELAKDINVPSNDCISRQAAINECNKRGAEHIGYAIAHLPTAQPEPKEGHWIRRDCGLDVECKCSKCGYRDFVEPGDEYWFKRNYCPNCGAKMTISTK